MSEFTLELDDLLGAAYPLTGLAVTPLSWSAHAMGGPDKADVEITGPRELIWACLRWLRFDARIRNEHGALVWWGYVNEVEVIAGGVGVGLTLDNMYNRVRVLYVHDVAGAPADAETSAGTDADSQNLYGIKEMLYSAGDSSTVEAEALRDRLIAEQGKPVATARGYGTKEDSARLKLRGHWQRAEWTYYADTTGKQTFEAADTEQSIGWALSASSVGFHAAAKSLHARGNALAGLRPGDKLEVSGATNAGNNGTKTVDARSQVEEAHSYTAATISFDPADDILDSADGFGDFAVADMVYITGSTNNSGYHYIKTDGGGHLEASPGWSGHTMVAETAGPSVTIEQLLHVRTEEALTGEVPGASITLTAHGGKVAQRVTASGSWNVGEAALLLQKHGGPTDNLVLKIFSESGGLPGTELGAATAVAGSTIGTSQRWVSFTFATPVALSDGVNYWLVLTRSGSADGTNYFSVGVDENTGDAGIFKNWNGSAWVDRTPNADMAYQLWGTMETTDLARQMLLTCAWCAGVDLQAASNLDGRSWRDGRRTVRDEVESLLGRGQYGGAHLWARVTPERTVSIVTESQPSATLDLLIDGAGLRTADGTMLTPGAVPAGRWAWLRDLPPGAAMQSLSPLFLQSVEYDAQRGRWEWEPRGAGAISEWRLRQG